MFVLGGGIAGAMLGWAVARRRGGKRLDILQYAGVFGLIFMILGLFLTIGLGRLG